MTEFNIISKHRALKEMLSITLNIAMSKVSGLQ